MSLTCSCPQKSCEDENDLLLSLVELPIILLLFVNQFPVSSEPLLYFPASSVPSCSSDKTLASLHHHCGGDVSLDQQPAGHITLTFPGLSTDANITPEPMHHRSDRTPAVSVCTWTIGVPPGRAVLLKFVRLDVGSSVTVRCVLNEDNREVLESGGSALLAHCDGDKATFTWTGAGRSSNGMQLSYSGEKPLPNELVSCIGSGRPTFLHPDHKSLILLWK